MDKPTKKTRKKYNVDVINALAKKYDFSAKYIKQMLNDERTPIFQDRIKSEYKEMCKSVNEVLNSDKI